MSKSHSAAPSALGYLYQLRYALYVVLTSKPDGYVLIENIDDIDWDQEMRPE